MILQRRSGIRWSTHLGRRRTHMRPVARIATLTFLAIALALGPAIGVQASRRDVAAQEVKRMVQQYRQALVRRDLATLDRIWSPDYTFTNPSGTLLSKKQRLANLKSGAT